MSAFEKQVKFHQDLAELRGTIWREISELNKQNQQGLSALNEEFSQKLPQFGDVTGWIDLQREYTDAVWQGYISNMEATGEILKSGLDEWNDLLREAFTPVETEAEAEDVVVEAEHPTLTAVEDVAPEATPDVEQETH